MPPIREVADRAGVSSTTVSHVINATRFVSDEVRSRVREAMEELGPGHRRRLHAVVKPAP
jgi:LacI family transcriptional regulator